MENFWDSRYSASDYVYGVLPNTFLKAKLEPLKPGKLLLPAEGEGRNAVYAAKTGWQVTAFDSSIEGQKKALLLAKTENVKFNYILCGYQDFNYQKDYYNAAALIFAHMPLEMRKNIHKRLINSLAPGGMLILEAFSKEQINYQSGGPKDLNMLYSAEEMMDDFGLLSELHIENKVIELAEGSFHQGEAAVIRLVGVK